MARATGDEVDDIGNPLLPVWAGWVERIQSIEVTVVCGCIVYVIVELRDHRTAPK